MQITRLHLSGFKSFPDRGEVRIEPGLTGVVGPNGCGKSNIVEALRWVMGESSARGLRGTEMDDVIFNGSAFRAPFDLAEVSLRIEGRIEGLAGIEGEQIDIARKLTRGLGSAYRINGREARARDIQMIFADASSGARSAAIIGQGQIGFIVDAKADQRRRMLEDAAGIGGLQGRRREAELKLGHTKDNLARVADMLQVQEQRLRALERQARDAERYRRISTELREHEIVLLALRFEEARRLEERMRYESEDIEAQVQAALERLAGDRAERQRLQAGIDEVTRQAASLGQEAARLAERLAHEQARHDQRLAARHEAQTRIAETRSDLERERARVRSAETGLVETVDAITRLVRESEDLEAAAEPRRLAVAKAQAALEAATAAHDSARADDLRADHDVEQGASKCEGLKLRLAEIDARLADRRADLDASPAIDAAQQALDDARARLEQATAYRDSLDARRLVLRAEPGWQAADLSDLESELASLRDKLAAAEGELVAARSARDAALSRLKLVERAGARIAGRQHANRASLEKLAIADARDRLHGLQEEERAASAGLETKRAMLARAVEHARSCEGALDRVGESVREARGELERLSAEAAALAAVTPQKAGEPIADRVAADPGYGEALAAALGDDLLASAEEGLVHWRDLGDAVGARDPMLPQGVRPLSDHVKAPSLLDRRLRQVGLCNEDDGARLQPALAAGQRLVSVTGTLWRWDGFVRRAEAEDGAVKLRHRKRLAQVERRTARLRDDLPEIQARMVAARAAHDEAVSAQEELQDTVRKAEHALILAERHRERMAGELDRLEMERRRLDEEFESLVVEWADHERELVELGSELAGLPDPARLEALAAQSRETVDEQERRRAECARALDQRRSALERIDEDQRATGQRIEELRLEVERQATRLGELREARALERASAQAEMIRLEEEKTGLEGDLAETVARLGAAQVRQEASRGALSEAQATLLEARASAGTATECETERQAALARVTREIEHMGGRDRALRGEIEAGRTNCAQLEARLARLVEQAAALPPVDEQALEGLVAESDGASRRHADLEDQRARAREAMDTLIVLVHEREDELRRLHERQAEARAARARAQGLVEAAIARIDERLRQPIEVALREVVEVEKLAAMGVAGLEAAMARLRQARERIGAVNLRAANEIEGMRDDIERGRAEEAELLEAIDRLERAISSLNNEARTRLKAVFATVEANFSDLFARLFGGGRAVLRLTNLEDPLNAGLELEAMPPGKKLAHVSLLSGGEKTLTALALVFAFFLATPSPLCVLDEVDAPLDDANVERFAALMRDIAERTGTRFLCVTHHALTMARMDRLYGVTMVEKGVSRLVSVRLEDAVEMRATA